MYIVKVKKDTARYNWAVPWEEIGRFQDNEKDLATAYLNNFLDCSGKYGMGMLEHVKENKNKG